MTIDHHKDIIMRTLNLAGVTEDERTLIYEQVEAIEKKSAIAGKQEYYDQIIEVTFIEPTFFEPGSSEYKDWRIACQTTEIYYHQLLRTKSPQAARTVLPNSCKTELIMYASLEQWQHIFNLRTSMACDPSMREVMVPLFNLFQQIYPENITTPEALADAA